MTPAAEQPRRTDGRRFGRFRRAWKTIVPVVFVLWTWLLAEATAAPPLIPRTSDGEGVRAGKRSTFHGGFALGMGADTNVFLENRAEDPVAAGVIWPTSWLSIGNRELRDGVLMTPAERTERIVDYHIGLVAGFRQYLHGTRRVRSQPRLSIGTQIRLSFLPGRKFSIDFEEDFYRGAFPGNYEVVGNFFNFSRFDHQGRLSFIGRPGGGRLSLAVGYRNAILWFGGETSTFRNNRMVNGLFHETKWRFFPKSSAVLQYSFDHTFYLSCCVNPGEGRNEDNYAHRLKVGYRGLLGKRFVLEALAGWGAGFYRQDPNGPSFNSFIGSATLSYYPTLQSLVYVSVYRDFHDSLFGNYYVDNGGRVALSHQFRWRMIANLGLGVAGRTYHGLPVPGEETSDIAGYEGRGAAEYQAKDVLFVLDANVEQPLGRIFSLMLSYNLILDSANFRVSYTNGRSDQLGYARHLVLFLAAIRI